MSSVSIVELTLVCLLTIICVDNVWSLLICFLLVPSSYTAKSGTIWLCWYSFVRPLISFVELLLSVCVCTIPGTPCSACNIACWIALVSIASCALVALSSVRTCSSSNLIFTAALYFASCCASDFSSQSSQRLSASSASCWRRASTFPSFSCHLSSTTSSLIPLVCSAASVAVSLRCCSSAFSSLRLLSASISFFALVYCARMSPSRSLLV